MRGGAIEVESRRTICRRRSGASGTTAATTSGRPTCRCRWRRSAPSAASTNRSPSTDGKTSTSACGCVARGVRAVVQSEGARLSRQAAAPRGASVERMLDRRALRRARRCSSCTCHPHWRAYLATGVNPVQLPIPRRASRRLGIESVCAGALPPPGVDRELANGRAASGAGAGQRGRTSTSWNARCVSARPA